MKKKITQKKAFIAEVEQLFPKQADLSIWVKLDWPKQLINSEDVFLTMAKFLFSLKTLGVSTVSQLVWYQGILKAVLRPLRILDQQLLAFYTSFLSCLRATDLEKIFSAESCLVRAAITKVVDLRSQFVKSEKVIDLAIKHFPEAVPEELLAKTLKQIPSAKL
ncbi:MAG: hypothetical protein K0S08_45 [Gammaproteobacteria bacterium]|jgi:hypothetical protein|nr:hypothetical protein [Gammaproteobacteria bacterium]